METISTGFTDVCITLARQTVRESRAITPAFAVILRIRHEALLAFGTIITRFTGLTPIKIIAIKFAFTVNRMESTEAGSAGFIITANVTVTILADKLAATIRTHSVTRTAVSALERS